MGLKELLSRAFTLRNEIKLHKHQLAMLREESVYAGGYGEMLARMNLLEWRRHAERPGAVLAMTLELTEDIGERLCRCLRLRYRVYGLVGRLKEPALRTLMMSRYVNLMTWEDIAEAMHYSVMSCHRLHAKAIAELEGSITPGELEELEELADTRRG